VEQPDLDRRAVVTRRLRRLACFLALGALLLAGRRALAPASADAPALVVEVPAGAGDDAIRRAIADAALIDEAVRAGWPLADPVVRHRRLEVLHTAGTPATGLAGLLVSGLPAKDPATRARLAWIGRELVRARVTAAPPTAGQLEAYRAAHPDRYDAGWLVVRHRLVSRARHGAAAEADARTLAAHLAGAGPDAAGGDPTLLPARVAGTPAAIDARFGAGFAAQVAAAPAGRWSGPYAGSFGFHVVWREEATAPPGAVDARVAHDWAHDHREDEVRRAIDALIRGRRVVVREVAP